jgi:UDP-2,4-diacetamido-2,4,6-trideoxy-beta-L-altropyranose hydrolase
MSEQNNFKLRIAVKADIKNIFDLSNEENVRENSTNSEHIIWENHVKWFENRLDDENYLFLIAENENAEFMGQVRHEFEKTQAVVSISIAPDFRGLDLAAPIISKSAKYLFENNEKIEFILAYIKEINIPSIKAFDQAGYIYFQQELINDEIFLVYRFLRN